MVLFLVSAVICVICKPFISVNYDMNSYLPEETPSTVSLELMKEEFGGAIPNARVMVSDISEKEAINYKNQISEIDGVISVRWLDDFLPENTPIEFVSDDLKNGYYKDNSALFSVTISDEKVESAVSEIRKLIGNENAMTGAAVSTAIATESTVLEVHKIAIIAIVFLMIVLVFSTTSWIEPLVIMLGLGVSVLINSGSNLIFGEISFVTNAAGNILQLAVSLDYSIFLIHRFEEYKSSMTPKDAMRTALVKSTSSILSSGLTTVIGFLALMLMQFQIGPDLGRALAKGIAISLLTVFLFMPGVILTTYKLMDKTRHRSFMPSFNRLGKLVVKTMFPLAIVFIILIVPSYYLSNHNSFYFGASHIFSEGTQYGDDTAKIETTFDKSDNYVLMVPKGDEKNERNLINELEKLENVNGITALTSYLGPMIPSEMVPDKLLSQFESEHYRRIVLSVGVDYEGAETEKLITSIRALADEYYPDENYLAGQGVSTLDLKTTITSDMVKVNAIAIIAVFIVLLLSLRSFLLPVILVLVIEVAIWINMSIPFLTGNSVFYIAYLIISSVQLGATVDYAILFTERYRDNINLMDRKSCVSETVSNVSGSILVSGIVLTVVGFLLGIISTHGLLSQLGFLLGKGTLSSLIMVLFVLPAFLYFFVKKKDNKQVINKRINK